MRLFTRFATASLVTAAMAFAAPAALPAESAQQGQQQGTTAAQDQSTAQANKAKHAKRAAGSAGNAVKNGAAATRDDAKSAAKGTTGTLNKLGRRTKDTVTGSHKDATARCRDGSYSYANNRADACVDHGGVATWIRK